MHFRVLFMQTLPRHARAAGQQRAAYKLQSPPILSNNSVCSVNLYTSLFISPHQNGVGLLYTNMHLGHVKGIVTNKTVKNCPTCSLHNFILTSKKSTYTEKRLLARITNGAINHNRHTTFNWRSHKHKDIQDKPPRWKTRQELLKEQTIWLD